MLDGANHERSKSRRARVGSRLAITSNRPIVDDRASCATLQMYRGSAARPRAVRRPDDRAARRRASAVRLSSAIWSRSSRARVVGEIQKRETGAVRHDDVVLLLDAILLGKDQLAKTVLAAHPIARTQDARRARVRCRSGVACATASTTCALMSAYSPYLREALARPAAAAHRVRAASRSRMRSTVVPSVSPNRTR